MPYRNESRLALCFALFSVVFLAFLPSTASAYELIDMPWPCKDAKWNSDPEFGILQISFSSAFARAAILEPASRINAVGGQSFDFIGWSVHADNTVTKNRNEVFKVTNLGPGVTGLASLRYGLCRIKEVDIRFPTTAQVGWRHGEPADYGQNYWEAKDTNAYRYIRHTAEHELLHAAGLNHEDNDYAFTNYGQRPWAHRGEGKQVEPLPDDRRGLRALYGNGGSEIDVGVLDTHVLPIQGSVGLGVENCYPTKGTGFSSIWDFGGRCGNTFETAVCPGDRVYTSYTIVNYGTQSANTTHRLYFSVGTALTNDDIPSQTEWSSPIHKNLLVGHSFVVPDGLPPGTYWPIVHIETDLQGEESSWNNSIPLLGQVEVPAECYD